MPAYAIVLIDVTDQEQYSTFDGCPHGRARQQKYGIRPNKPIPPQSKAET